MNPVGEPIATAVLTVSDGVTEGTRADESGDVASSMLVEAGFEVRVREVVPDERDRIEEALRRLSAAHVFVVTTGGTGFGPRDVTPEATRAVLDREAPGLAELMRREGLEATPMAALSRSVAGALGGTLVINLPGSPKGVRESLAAVLPLAGHAIGLLGGATGAHPTGHHVTHPNVPAVASHEMSRPWVEAKAVKVIGEPPCQVGAWMSIVPGGAIRGSLGCAEFDAGATEAAAEVLAAGSPQTRLLHHDLGDIEVYLEPHLSPPRAVVVSATDVARYLRRYLSVLGYRVELLEPRTERLGRGDEPSLDSLDDAVLDDNTSVVLTDHDAPEVAETLGRLLRSQVRFIGVMGSRRHVGRYVEDLRAAGFADADLARIRSPLGLDLGGRGPEEVALSIAAGLVADRYGRQGGWLDR
jgi:molybdopterin adenylyltransferase